MDCNAKTLPRTLDDIHPLLVRIKSRGLEKWNSKVYGFYWFWCVSNFPNERSTLSKCTFLTFFSGPTNFMDSKANMSRMLGDVHPFHMSITSKGSQEWMLIFKSFKMFWYVCIIHTFLNEHCLHIWRPTILMDSGHWAMSTHYSWWKDTHPSNSRLCLLKPSICRDIGTNAQKELRNQLTNCIVALRQKTQNSS